jgi:integrase
MAKRRRDGVTLIQPNPERRTSWRARYTDPDSGKTKWKTLPKHAQRTKADREDWCVRLSDQLERRRRELEDGATRATGTRLTDAVERYYKAHPRLRPTTVTAYQAVTDKLLAFARRHRITSTDELDRRALMRFREEVVNEPRKRMAPGGRRGKWEEGKEPRSAFSINRDLRGCRTVLGYLADADLFPRLSHDDLRRCFKQVEVPRAKKKSLKVAELRKLLDACLRHDAETFDATRGEQRGDGTVGTTLRYTPIGGFTLYVLLTGCRLGEALRADWKDVDLEDGEIHIGTESKTKVARDIDIDVTPALRRLLAAQKLRTGGRSSVWDLTEGETTAAMKRLKEYGAPTQSGWQLLRVTCQSYLASAPSIYSAASIFLAAKRGGHSVAVCEKHYAGAIKNISPEAKTLEAAMQIERHCKQVIASVGQKRRAA